MRNIVVCSHNAGDDLSRHVYAAYQKLYEYTSTKHSLRIFESQTGGEFAAYELQPSKKYGQKYRWIVMKW